MSNMAEGSACLSSSGITGPQRVWATAMAAQTKRLPLERTRQRLLH